MSFRHGPRIRERRAGQPVIVTKHGKPVVKLVPAELDGASIFGFMAGKGKIVGDIETSAPLEDWNLK